VLGGYLSLKLDSKKLIATSILIGSILTLLTPIAASLNHKIVYVCRFLIGISQGIFLPTLFTFWSIWAPSAERSRVLAISTAYIDFSLNGIFSTYLCSLGWSSTFYVFGTIGILICIIWMIIASKSPSENRFISDKEKNYLKKEIDNNPTFNNKIPWSAIMKSQAFWSLVIADFSSMLGFTTILREKIFSEFNLYGLFSLFFVLNKVFSSFLGDKLIESKILSIKNVRQIFTSLGFLFPMISLIGIFVEYSNFYIFYTFGLATM